MGATTETGPGAPQRASAPVRVGLAMLIGLLTLQIFVGSPILSLWIASQVQGGGPPSLSALFIFVVCFAIFSYVLFQLIGWLSVRFDKASGVKPGPRQRARWLESLRGDRHEGYEPQRLKPVERILVGIVIVAVAAFEIWFFFFSTSPIDTRSGREGVVPPVIRLL
jgi:hypothetical protein